MLAVLEGGGSQRAVTGSQGGSSWREHGVLMSLWSRSGQFCYRGERHRDRGIQAEKSINYKEDVKMTCYPATAPGSCRYCPQVWQRQK